MKKKRGYGHMIKKLISLGDYVVINIVFFLMQFIFPDETFFRDKIVWLLLNISYLPVMFQFFPEHDKRIVFVDHIMRKCSKAVAIHALCFISLLFFIEKSSGTNESLLIFYAILYVVMNIWWLCARKLLSFLRRKGYNFTKVIIVGAGRTGNMLYEEFKSDAGYGFKVDGFFDDNTDLKKKIKLYKGTVADAETYALNEDIDEIYCALPGSQDLKIMRLHEFCEHHAIRFYIVPEIHRFMLRQLTFQQIGDTPVLSMRKEPLQNINNRVVKRLIDIVGSLFILVIYPFFYIPISIAIKLSSKGPIIFKQKRTGLYGKEFTCYKFRTMRVNADADKKQATQNDPRKTKIGDFLRKSNLDELPQLWNVLKGDMSLVGPRPHMLKHTEDYSKIIDRYMLRHLIKPGLTGWAQVNGYRGETRALYQMEKRVQYDVWYIENWSLWLDVKIILLTIFVMCRGDKNAF